MAHAGQDWGGYLGGLAAFAGTLFALALAARQIRGPLIEDPDPRESHAYFVDSIAVTVELAAAAALALLYDIEDTLFFSIAVIWVAAWSGGLSLKSAFAYCAALKGPAFIGRPDDRSAARKQALGNVLPVGCYSVAVLYALHVFDFSHGGTWGYALATSWLTFSGVFQSIGWYARMWDREKPRVAGQTAPGSQ